MTNRSRTAVCLRFARVAFSAVFAILCLLVIGFWARSYWYQDGGFIGVPFGKHIQFNAGEGRMCLWFENSPINYWFSWREQPIEIPLGPNAENRIPWFNLGFWPNFVRVYLAHWVLAVATGALAAAPWLPRRFSLRFMLIATSVVAAVAAVIAYVDKTF